MALSPHWNADSSLWPGGLRKGPATAAFAAGALILAGFWRPAYAQTELVVDTGEQRQRIDGFGTALAWWLNAPYASQDFRELYWSDLGASMLRVDLHINVLRGEDGSLATPVTLEEDLDANIAEMDFQAQGVANFGGVAQAAQALALEEPKIIATVWTPPHWMKGEEIDPQTGEPNGRMPTLSGSDSGGGSIIDTPENLRQFGLYLASYVEGFEREFGAPIYALSIQNEPAFRQTFGSCVYDPARYAKTLKAVKAVFEEKGLPTKFFGPEDLTGGEESNPWILWRHMNYVEAARQDPEAMAAIDFWSAHAYSADGASAARPVNLWRQYLAGRSSETHPEPAGAWWTGIAGDGKRSWMSESSGEPPTYQGALGMAAAMQDALVLGDVSAYLYWQTATGSSADEFTLTGGNDPTQPKYVAAKHFFRHIRPGARRVALSPEDPSGIWASAYAHPGNRTLTVVALNLGDQPDELQISFAKAGVETFDVARLTSERAPWSDVGPVPVSNREASIAMPAFSLLTLQGGVADDQSLEPDESLAEWRKRWFGSEDADGQAAIDAAPSQDGIPNLAKYALGLDPFAPQNDRLPQPSLLDGRLGITLELNPDAGDVEAVVEVSDDLSEWRSDPEAVETIEDLPDRLTARESLDSEARGRFLRARFELSEESPAQ